MNAVILSAHGVPVTTSLAIAEGTSNSHKSVMELVRAYLLDLSEFGGVAFETAPFETAGGTQHREIAILNEQQATLLITYMRNTDIVRSFKKRLVRDFWALRVPAKPAELSRMDILTLAMESERGRLVAVEQLAIAGPKADALDRIAGADGSMCITDAAKAIKLQPKRLFAWMHANDWIYKRAGNSKWVACQARLKSAHLDCEYITVLRADGTEKNIANVLVTAKGLAKLAEVAA